MLKPSIVFLHIAWITAICLLQVGCIIIPTPMVRTWNSTVWTRLDPVTRLPVETIEQRSSQLYLPAPNPEPKQTLDLGGPSYTYSLKDHQTTNSIALNFLATRGGAWTSFELIEGTSYWLAIRRVELTNWGEPQKLEVAVFDRKGFKHTHRFTSLEPCGYHAFDKTISYKSDKGHFCYKVLENVEERLSGPSTNR